MFGFEQRGEEQTNEDQIKQDLWREKKITKENHVIETKIFGTWNY